MFEIEKIEYVSKTFRLKKQLVEKLSMYASDNNISLNQLISQCCEYALENMDVKSKNNSIK